MTELTFAQKENIGFQFVLDAMQPCSPYGQEHLRQLRPMGKAQKGELLRQLCNVQRVLEGEAACKAALSAVLRVLMAVKMVRATAQKCLETDLNEIELFELKRFLLQTRELLPHWHQAQAVLQLEGIAFRDTEAALDILDPEANRVATFYISDAYDPALAAIRAEKRALETQIRLTDADREKERLLAQRSAVAAREEQAEARIREAMSLALRPYIPAMLENMAAMAELDVTVEKARLARRWGGVMPVLTDSRVAMTQMCNPRILESLKDRGQDFTPISITLDRGATVITGANMGGKSVALKTLALNLLLIQCGCFPFAKTASAPLFDGIYILSEDLENVERGLSSFGGEMVRFNEIVKRLDGQFAFLLLDEFARGTNPEEGAAIVQAVTEYLNRQNAVSVLVTHFDGVAAHAGAHYQVVGLRELDLEQVRRELAGLQGLSGAEHIGRYMNYGLYRVEDARDCPRDALNICRLLGMEPEILEIVEKNYGVETKKC